MVLKAIRYINKYKVGGNSLFKEFSVYSISTIFFHSSRILTELLVARLVGPELFGVWYLLNLLLTYRSVTFLGVVNGMLLKVPMLRGSNEQHAVSLHQNVAFSAMLLSVMLTALALLALMFVGSGVHVQYLGVMILLFFSNQLYYFIDALFIANAQFNNISKMQMACAVLFPCLTVPLVYRYGLSGFIVGTSLAYLAAAALAFWKYGIQLKFQLNQKVLRHLIAIGFPIMLVGIIYSFFLTVDRWMIELMLGTEQLGVFSLAILTFGTLTILPATIARQFYPKMAFDWGNTRSSAVLEAWCRKQMRYCSYVVLATVIGVQVLFPLLIWYWLPQYQASITSVLIIALGVLSMPLAAGWGDVINILGRQRLLIWVTAMFIVANVGFTYVCIKLGWGLAGVALATAAAFILFNITVRSIAKRLLAHG